MITVRDRQNNELAIVRVYNNEMLFADEILQRAGFEWIERRGWSLDGGQTVYSEDDFVIDEE